MMRAFPPRVVGVGTGGEYGAGVGGGSAGTGQANAEGHALPVKPVPAKPAQGTLRVINFDLQGQKGPLPVEQYQQLEALIVYLEPDVLALHNVQKPAADAASKELPRLVLAMGMYVAYQPLTDALGSALLSRYPLSEAKALADPSGAALGMQVTVQARGRNYTVLVVRPPNPEISKAAAEVVSAAVKANPSGQYVALVSFSPGTSVGGALSAWGRVGLYDLGGWGARGATATYPSEGPKTRLDFLLLSAGLREGAKYRVIRDRRFINLSWHLPVEVTLTR